LHSPRTSSWLSDLCHCCTDIGNTVGVRLMGWQTLACYSSNMPHRSSHPASSTLLLALPPAARCRHCPSLFGTDEVPAHWPSFLQTGAQTSRQQKYFSNSDLLGHFTDTWSTFGSSLPSNLWHKPGNYNLKF
jgi:hypothetical protein